jgi:hypothetical protein
MGSKAGYSTKEDHKSPSINFIKLRWNPHPGHGIPTSSLIGQLNKDSLY